MRVCLISRLQHPDPTPGCGKAQPQLSTALRNKLWPVQTGGAWTDTQQPHQGSGSQNTTLASTPRKRKAGKAHTVCTPTQARAGSSQKAPVTQPSLPFPATSTLRGSSSTALHIADQGINKLNRKTLLNLYFHSQALSSNGEKGQGGYSLHTFCVLAKTRNSLSEY